MAIWGYPCILYLHNLMCAVLRKSDKLWLMEKKVETGNHVRIQEENIVHNPCVTSLWKGRMSMLLVQRQWDTASLSSPKGTAKGIPVFHFWDETYKYFNLPSSHSFMFVLQENLYEHHLVWNILKINFGIFDYLLHCGISQCYLICPVYCEQAMLSDYLFEKTAVLNWEPLKTRSFAYGY